MHPPAVRPSPAAAPNDDVNRIAGDDLVPDAGAQITRGLTIVAPPVAVWPCLLDMVHGEGGPSARWNLPRRFEVLVTDPPRALVLGSVWDVESKHHVPFAGPRPACFWRATWALSLEPLLSALGERATRLRVRTRVVASADALRWLATWMHPFNDFMDPGELGRLKARCEALPPR